MNCCAKTSLVFFLIFFTIGMILILAGFMRATIENSPYQETECTVISTQVREIVGICVAGKCSPSKYDGLVKVALQNGIQEWSTVISSYTKQIVVDYINSHFTISAKTQCFVASNGDVKFSLEPTTVFLVLSIIILIVSSLFLFGSIVSCYKESTKKSSYIDLDKTTTGAPNVFGDRVL